MSHLLCLGPLLVIIINPNLKYYTKNLSVIWHFESTHGLFLSWSTEPSSLRIIQITDPDLVYTFWEYRVRDEPKSALTEHHLFHKISSLTNDWIKFKTNSNIILRLKRSPGRSGHIAITWFIVCFTFFPLPFFSKISQYLVFSSKFLYSWL